MTLSISNASAIAGLDAILALIDGGTGPGFIRIYDGTVPDDADAATGSPTQIAHIVCSDPAYAGATDGGGVATAAIDVTPALTDGTGDATATGAWFRIYDSDTGSVIQGAVHTSTGELNFATVSFVAGAEITITALPISLDETA